MNWMHVNDEDFNREVTRLVNEAAERYSTMTAWAGAIAFFAGWIGGCLFTWFLYH